MSALSAVMLKAVKKANETMANHHTPFIFNEWYVAAFSNEINRNLLSRFILGKRIVLYRTEAGQPVALADRCAHRAFPLSKGALDGDHVICGYHGFRYDAEGECIEVPSSDKCPKGIGVQHYQLVETGPLIWIWMGDPTLADVSKIPVQSWITDSEWTTSFGYYEMQSNYVSVHENLLDLTHLSFVHAKTFGTPDFAKAAYKTEIQDGYFSITRDVVPTLLPPIWGRPTGLEGCTTAARIVKSEFISPALHVTTGTYYDSALPISSRPKFSIKALHVVTPFTSSSCHYFIVFGRDFVKGDNEVTSFMTSSLFAAFDEDKAALAALEKVWLTTEEQEMFEISTAADGPSVSMRRYLKSRADSEANNSMN